MSKKGDSDNFTGIVIHWWPYSWRRHCWNATGRWVCNVKLALAPKSCRHRSLVDCLEALICSLFRNWLLNQLWLLFSYSYLGLSKFYFYLLVGLLFVPYLWGHIFSSPCPKYIPPKCGSKYWKDLCNWKEVRNAHISDSYLLGSMKYNFFFSF